jgi:hypothetical protein
MRVFQSNLLNTFDTGHSHDVPTSCLPRRHAFRLETIPSTNFIVNLLFCTLQQHDALPAVRNGYAKGRDASPGFHLMHSKKARSSDASNLLAPIAHSCFQADCTTMGKCLFCACAHTYKHLLSASVYRLCVAPYEPCCPIRTGVNVNAVGLNLSIRHWNQRCSEPLPCCHRCVPFIWGFAAYQKFREAPDAYTNFNIDDVGY